MSESLRHLDEPCPYGCDTTIGEHTMKQWAAHIDNADGPSIDLPYEEVPGEPLTFTYNGANVLAADHIVAKATVAGAPDSPLGLNVPCLIIEYQIGNPTGPPRPVTTVALLGTPAIMRKLGTLLRDTAFGAAKAAEQRR